MKDSFQFTTENLIVNIEKLGPWSSWGLASEALQHYFPNQYDNDGNCIGDVQREAELCQQLGCTYWHDVVVKYHKEVGYKAHEGIFPKDCVNEY